MLHPNAVYTCTDPWLWSVTRDVALQDSCHLTFTPRAPWWTQAAAQAGIGDLRNTRRSNLQVSLHVLSAHLAGCSTVVNDARRRVRSAAPPAAWLQRVGVATSSCWRAAHTVHSFPPPLPTPFPTTYFSPLPAFFFPSSLSLRPWSGFPGCSPWPDVCWLQTLANPRHICTRFSLDSCSRMQKPIPLPTPLPLHTQPTPLP